MSDDWERANDADVHADDAMKKAADGYALIEHYLDWLAGPRASTPAGASVDVDLTVYAAGFVAVAPTYTVTARESGTVALQPDAHTARFQPSPGFHGVASFDFTVKGSDGTAYTSTVRVLVVP